MKGCACLAERQGARSQNGSVRAAYTLHCQEELPAVYPPEGGR